MYHILQAYLRSFVALDIGRTENRQARKSIVNRRVVSILLCSLASAFLLLLSTSPLEAAWQPSLAVGLQTNGGNSIDLVPSGGPVKLLLQDEKKAQVKFPEDQTIHVEIQGNGFRVNGKTFSSDVLNFKAEKEELADRLLWSLNGKSYRGGLRITKQGGKIIVINLIPTEDYLLGTVGEEMPPKWNEEALKAQVVAARTFALKNRKRHAKEGYDLCNTPHCQVYGGTGSEHPSVERAVKMTYGEVLTYQDKLIDAVFHTDSGGMTENSQNVWGSAVAYLAPAKEVRQKTMPWDMSIPEAKFTATLSKHGFSIGSLKRIELSPLAIGREGKDRFFSGRVKSAKFIGTKGSACIPGNKLRDMFSLRSTLFEMHLSRGSIDIHGYGWGHGLGLSQWGAQAFAKQGMKYDNILKHYYRNISIKKLY